MPQSYKSKSTVPKTQMADSPVPVVRDQFVPRADAEEYNPNAPVGKEEPTAPTYEVEDEREENMNERINQDTRISQASVDNLKDTIGGGATINQRLRPTDKNVKAYKQEKELDEAFD